MEKRAKIGYLVVFFCLVANFINLVWYMLPIVYIGSAIVAAYGLLLIFQKSKEEEVVENE